MHMTLRAYDEPTLLRLALAAEQVVERRPPGLFHCVLPTFDLTDARRSFLN